MPEERDVVIFTPLEMIGRVGHLLSHTEVQAHETARVINRGTGGREVALCITKIQEAQDWLHRAEILLGAKE